VARTGCPEKNAFEGGAASQPPLGPQRECIAAPLAAGAQSCADSPNLIRRDRPTPRGRSPESQLHWSVRVRRNHRIAAMSPQQAPMHPVPINAGYSHLKSAVAIMIAIGEKNPEIRPAKRCTQNETRSCPGNNQRTTGRTTRVTGAAYMLPNRGTRKSPKTTNNQISLRKAPDIKAAAKNRAPPVHPATSVTSAAESRLSI
jgi:hypothetical protein